MIESGLEIELGISSLDITGVIRVIIVSRGSLLRWDFCFGWSGYGTGAKFMVEGERWMMFWVGRVDLRGWTSSETGNRSTVDIMVRSREVFKRESFSLNVEKVIKKWDTMIGNDFEIDPSLDVTMPQCIMERLIRWYR